MAIVNGYTTLAAVRAALGITNAQDTSDDSRIEDCIEAASRAIDRLTGRVYYASESVARYYTARDAETVDIDDALTVTKVETDDDGDRTYGTTWAATDYDLEPYNETPKTKITVTPSGAYTFPLWRNAVKVTGTWGYASAAPDNVAEACVLLSMILFKRRDAVFGTAGNPEIGEVVVLARQDPQITMLLPSPRVRLV